MSAALRKLKKRILLIAGTLSVGLGVIGIFIPILPTTPFLLLGAVCYMRSSSRLYNALLCNRFLGNYLKKYLEGRGMPLRMKVGTLILLWTTIISSAVLLTENTVVRMILFIVAIGVTIHISLLRQPKPSPSMSYRHFVTAGEKPPDKPVVR